MSSGQWRLHLRREPPRMDWGFILLGYSREESVDGAVVWRAGWVISFVKWEVVSRLQGLVGWDGHVGESASTRIQWGLVPQLSSLLRRRCWDSRWLQAPGGSVGQCFKQPLLQASGRSSPLPNLQSQLRLSTPRSWASLPLSFPTHPPPISQTLGGEQASWGRSPRGLSRPRATGQKWGWDLCGLLGGPPWAAFTLPASSPSPEPHTLWQV